MCFILSHLDGRLQPKKLVGPCVRCEVATAKPDLILCGEPLEPNLSASQQQQEVLVASRFESGWAAKSGDTGEVQHLNEVL
jgi:hypothetical protein